MPTVKGMSGPYRFFFYSFDCNEREHVHVSRDKATCKFWLDPLELAYNHGFKSRNLNVIRELITENLQTILESWNEHCS
jgi:hypothetical protein